MVEVVTVEPSQNQLPTSQNQLTQAVQKQRLGYNHPGYGHVRTYDFCAQDSGVSISKKNMSSSYNYKTSRDHLLVQDASILSIENSMSREIEPARRSLHRHGSCTFTEVVRLVRSGRFIVRVSTDRGLRSAQVRAYDDRAVLKHRNSLQKSLCPVVVMCPYLCSSVCRFRLLVSPRGREPPGARAGARARAGAGQAAASGGGSGGRSSSSSSSSSGSGSGSR